MKLINIGFGSMVAMDRVIAIVKPDSSPVKRLIQEAKEKLCLIDATYGRKTKSVIVFDSDHIVLSSLQPDVISGRILEKDEKEFNK